MFEGITRGLTDAFKKLRGRGRLTADNIRDGLREVRRAFLEADVNFNVVTDFIARVEAKAVGQDVLARVDPSEQIIKIVYEELVGLMGPVDHKIPQRADRPVVLMLCGLQGSGKTTTAAKLALDAQGPRPQAAARRRRLAAARVPSSSCKTLGEQIGVPVYSEATNPVDVCRNAVAQAKQTLCDTVILDTAGRLQIDDELMDELKQIDKQVKPDEVLPRRRRDDRPGGGERRQGVQRRPRAERLHPDQARRRRPRRGGPVDQGRHRRADQVRRRRREGRQARGVRPRADGRPDPGPGRPDGRGREDRLASSRRCPRRR